eukprot:Protomagalhaensia_sp_Gyna_25__1553@NODE_17_length_8134_cov_42_750093_g11_i0_p7_GENE_NODE_17_length_8134_cov_42_750093_g11_i0NODE_17_length_8134_cov_42_750093_g11_i0_p7_ORF_typecomplete_len115_score4_76_NODE_17_length_8134_cov_42_750093_g11_i036714015
MTHPTLFRYNLDSFFVRRPSFHCRGRLLFGRFTYNSSQKIDFTISLFYSFISSLAVEFPWSKLLTYHLQLLNVLSNLTYTSDTTRLQYPSTSLASASTIHTHTTLTPVARTTFI